MFGTRRKNREERINNLLEEEVSVGLKEEIFEDVKVPSKSEMKRNRKAQKRQISNAEVLLEVETETAFNENFIWADNEICQLRKNEIPIKAVVEQIEHQPIKQKESIKKELDEYFLKNNSDLFIKEGSKRKFKKLKKRRLRNYYKYRGHKFQTPYEFLEFLDKNPKKLDKIASTVLDDELFFKWLGKNSHQFIESVKDFRTFKKKIEN